MHERRTNDGPGACTFLVAVWIIWGIPSSNAGRLERDRRETREDPSLRPPTTESRARGLPRRAPDAGGGSAAPPPSSASEKTPRVDALSRWDVVEFAHPVSLSSAVRAAASVDATIVGVDMSTKSTWAGYVWQTDRTTADNLDLADQGYVRRWGGSPAVRGIVILEEASRGIACVRPQRRWQR